MKFKGDIYRDCGKERGMIIKKSAGPFWWFLLPKMSGRTLKKSLRVYWLGFVFIKTFNREKKKTG